MARLPSRDDLGPLPGVPVVHPGRGLAHADASSAYEASAQADKALGGLGEKISGIGMEIVKKAEEQEDYEATKRLIEFRRSEEQAYEQHKRTIKPGGDGFQDGWNDGFHERAHAFFGTEGGNFPNRLRQKVDTKLLEIGEGLSTKALTHQVVERDRYEKESLGDALGKTLKDIEGAPTRLPGFKSEGLGVIELSPMNPADKYRVRKEFLRNADKTAGVAEAMGANTGEDFNRVTGTLFVSAPGKARPVDRSGSDFFRTRLRARESSARADTINEEGYAGFDQFGAPRLAQLGLYKPGAGENIADKSAAGGWSGKKWSGTFNIEGFPEVKTVEQFLATPEAQNAAQEVHAQEMDREIKRAGLDKYVGQTIAGVPITQDGLRAMLHLGGVGSAKRALESGGRVNPADRNGTSVLDYAREFATPSAPTGGAVLPSAGDAAPSLPGKEGVVVTQGSMKPLWDGEEKGESSYEGPYQNLTLSERKAIYGQLETRRKALLSGMEKEITKFEAVAQNGYALPAPMLEDLARRVKEFNDPTLNAHFVSTLGLAELTSQLNKMSPMQVEKMVGDERQRVLREGMTEAAQKRLKHVEGVLANMRTAINTDPLTWASRVGIIAHDDLLEKFGDDAALQRRAEQARQVGAYYNQAPIFFTKNEKDALTDVIRKGGDPMMAVLGKIVTNFGPDARLAMSEFAKDMPVAAWIGGMAVDAGKNNGATMQAAKDAAQAVELKKDKNFKAIIHGGGADGDEHKTTARAALGTTFQALPGNDAAAIATADDIFEARAFRKGNITKFDAELWKQGLKEALGEHVNKGVTYGGVYHQSPGLFGIGRGSPVVVPSNMKQSGFGDVLSTLREGDLVDAFGAGPSTGAGNPLSMGVLRRATMVTVGPGQYWMAVGDPTGADPQWVENGMGKRYVLDVNQLEPLLKKRRPDLYLGYVEPVVDRPPLTDMGGRMNLGGPGPHQLEGGDWIDNNPRVRSAQSERDWPDSPWMPVQPQDQGKHRSFNPDTKQHYWNDPSMRPVQPVVFTGEGAKTADRAALAEAKERDGVEGESPQSIWQTTGWFKRPDGKWISEISDKKAEVALPKEGGTTSLRGGPVFVLKDVLKHPDLYAAYPELEKVAVKIGMPILPKLMFNPGGAYVSGHITIAEEVARDPRKLRSVLLHEVQHAIQDQEGELGIGAIISNLMVPYEKRKQENEAFDVQSRDIYSEESNKLSPPHSSEDQRRADLRKAREARDAREAESRKSKRKR